MTNYGEHEDTDIVDKEWEDWTRLVAQKQKEQAFYPSPLVQEEDERGPGAPPMPSAAMYGRYSRQLGEYARDEASKLRTKRRTSVDLHEGILPGERVQRERSTFALVLLAVWQHTFARLGEDWVFLALLGVIMAVLSFAMDRGISVCNNARLWLYRDLTDSPWAQYAAWIALPVCLVLFSAGFVHLVAPQSIGSGIPEMKTILRGVALKEYLTFRTLVAKVIGLTATLGSGMPLGKEGPFVHIASIVATLLGRLVTGFQGIYANEGRNTEMLAAACAVGVASCFAAPVGGVLFSIEVTTVYFAVRNYWRGFFAAVCGATVFRLLAVWFDQADTVTAVFRTGFSMDFPFDPQELVAFAVMGGVCGLGGALYVRVHRRYVALMRSNRRVNEFLQRNRFIYPGLVALTVATVSFPGGAGRYFAADLNTHDQVTSLFSNFTWTASSLSVEERAVVRHWTAEPHAGVFVTLFCFALFTFAFSIIASTLPVPSGSFIPVFKIGAAMGRILGEGMHLLFPLGLRYGNHIATVVPGGYAAVGAAAFSGAVTRTISVSVIVFEMTGQITHLVPIMIAVLVSNAVAGLLGPSIYDSIILIKRLPYLPDLLPATGKGAYDLCVEDFMVRDIKYVYKGITYKELKEILLGARRLRSLPLVDSPDGMVLLGSVRRPDLIALVEKHVGRERRLQVAAERQRERQLHQHQRRPSRFRVEPASADPLLSVPRLGAAAAGPKKSILKKTNSFTMIGSSAGGGGGGGPHSSGFWSTSPSATPYQTVTGAESRVRLAFEAIFRKSSQLQDVDAPNGETESLMTDSVSQERPLNPKKVQLPRERVIDMSPEDQRKWEDEEMSQAVDLSECRVDPAPFQLVERTSLLKVHSLFSLVGISHAYVTAIGRLVGVVGLKDLRRAIEDANAGRRPQQVQEKEQQQQQQQMPVNTTTTTTVDDQQQKVATPS